MEQVGKLLNLEPQKAQLIIPNTPINPCPLCEGNEWISTPEGVKRCKCFLERLEKAKFERLIDEANMGSMRHMTLESYQPKSDRQEKAFEEVSKGHGGLYLYGPYGTGKTHLMAGTVFRALKDGTQACLISVPRLLDTIRRKGRDNDTEVETLAYTIPYLCLDDIGKQKDSDWTEERLFMLLDERYKRFMAGEGQTSLTSQFPLDLLAQRMDGAIISRIKGMCRVFLVDGEDNRGQK